MFQISLLNALRRTCELLARSEEAVYSPLTPAEVRGNLMEMITDLEAGKAIENGDLAIEFAPTSTVQEIAMANGWHDEYLELAKVVDTFST